MKTLNVYSIIGLVSEFQHLFFVGNNSIDVIALLLILGISAKSAQLPFHTWLVNAMSAPSPVSALIHAATLVTSGVFLIIRFSHIFEYSSYLEWLSVLGVSTAFFAGVTALVQNDFKRIIAYSTCSQLGYMVFACGLSSYNVSFFHLLNRGCFKALLFLGAGATIHSINNKQEIR
jgi:NADH:ubiquinone oxidoreductase subunit 5 (subunit L)/multisubunit Na+/H+ antiporter MnhA subunit